MKYAIKFFRGSNATKEADEIILKYNKKTAFLIQFVKDHPQRVIADITSLDKPEENLSIFAAAARENKSFSVKLRLDQGYLVPDLNEENIKYFYDAGCGTWDGLMSQLKDGVSDVYVVNELAFDLINVRKVCNEYGVQIRSYPNVAQSSASGSMGLDTFKFFFVRPEDVELYSDFIDVFEFFGPLDKQDILYKIYKSGRWADSLNYLILGLKLDINGNMIAPGWAEKRIGCQKSCYYGRCKMCDRAAELGEAMRENGLEFDGRKVDNEHTIIREFMQNGPKSTSWYSEKVSEGELSEEFSDSN